MASNNQYQQHLNSNWQTLMYIDIYSVTHTVHSLNGSKSHTVRETQKSDNISVLKD